MSLQDCAQAAVAVFPFVNVQTSYGTYSLPVVMVAIAGAETGGTYDDASPGDYGLGGPSCQGYTSWGLWQIHNVHAAYLVQVTGSSDPCAWASWLASPMNCAKAALAVLGSGLDLGAWTTWNEGTYSGWLSAAVAAVSAAAPAGQPPSSAVYQATVGAPSTALLAGIAAAAVVGLSALTGWPAGVWRR